MGGCYLPSLFSYDYVAEVAESWFSKTKLPDEIPGTWRLLELKLDETRQEAKLSLG